MLSLTKKVTIRLTESRGGTLTFRNIERLPDTEGRANHFFRKYCGDRHNFALLLLWTGYRRIPYSKSR